MNDILQNLSFRVDTKQVIKDIDDYLDYTLKTVEEWEEEIGYDFFSDHFDIYEDLVEELKDGIGLPLLGYGTHRATFDLGDTIIKIPLFKEDGCNDNEWKLYERYGGIINKDTINLPIYKYNQILEFPKAELFSEGDITENRIFSIIERMFINHEPKIIIDDVSRYDQWGIVDGKIKLLDFADWRIINTPNIDMSKIKIFE